jgi:hypothetical protein
MGTRTTVAVTCVTALAVVFLAPAAASKPVACPEDCWHPTPTTQPWQWQLTGKVDLAVTAPVFDVDGFDTGARLVDRIHKKPARAVCYLSVGTYERWRPDAHRFPTRLLGRPLDPPFQNERWLDIRRLRALEPIMRRRLGICARKGFDAVEPDNVDGYQNRTGFPLSQGDQLRYNRWVANAAHRKGLAVGLKNDLGQVRRLLSYFDFAVNEQCFQYHECSKLDRFIAAGKPVFGAEYNLPRSRFCAKSRDHGFSTIRKHLALGAWRRSCGP